MYYVYILKNQKSEYYTGFSADLKTRIQTHKEKGVKSTKSNDYNLVWYCAFETKTKALDFEKYLKQGSGFAFARKRLV